MLKAYKGGLQRKRVSLEVFENYGVSRVRRWLMKVLPKDTLQQILEFLSPRAIAKTLGVDHGTISRVAKDYGVEIKKGSHYSSIWQLILNRGKSYQHYKEFQY